jgi:DNA-binding GntR family transcriptional regulator
VPGPGQDLEIARNIAYDLAAVKTDQNTGTKARLRADILAGTFAPGQRLTEALLSKRYGVGRGVIRAALVELRAEGLVDIEPNRGAVVRRITLHEAIEIAEARRALESLVAARAAANTTAAAKDALRETIAEMREAVAAGDQARYSELNRMLHRRIWEMSGHGVAQELIANLRDRSAHHQFRLAVMPGRPEESLQQHADIVDAIVAGDSEGAKEAMRDHLTSVIAALSRWSELGVVI